MAISPIANEGHAWRRATDAALLLMVAAVLPAMAFRSLHRPDNPLNPIAVVYAPWTNASSAATRATAAGASLLRFGAFDFVVVVKPDDPAYAERALARGALFVLDPRFRALCERDPPEAAG